jgi:hypothetical protein
MIHYFCNHGSNSIAARTPSNGPSSLLKNFQTHAHVNYFHSIGPQYSPSTSCMYFDNTQYINTSDTYCYDYCIISHEYKTQIIISVPLHILIYKQNLEFLTSSCSYNLQSQYETKTKLCCRSPQANYTDWATAACRRSWSQPLRIEGVAWSVQQIPTATGFLDHNRYCSILNCPHEAQWTPFQTPYFSANLIGSGIEPGPLDL